MGVLAAQQACSAAAGSADGPTWPPAASPAPASSRARPAPEDPDPDRLPQPAFSGATPSVDLPHPAGELAGLLTVGADDLHGLLSVAGDLDASPYLDLPGVRGDVLRLVHAALDQDARAARALLQQLDSRGTEAAALGPLVALAALGERLVVAAGYNRDDRSYDAAAGAAVAQGDTVAGRADSRLHALAPHCSRDLVRFAVRLAAGAPEAALAHLVTAPPQDLTLVTAVLLAQTVLDGGGDVDELAAELEDLLPG